MLRDEPPANGGASWQGHVAKAAAYFILFAGVCGVVDRYFKGLQIVGRSVLPSMYWKTNKNRLRKNGNLPVLKRF